jgi:sulfite exporter TauE/SafE
LQRRKVVVDVTATGIPWFAAGLAHCRAVTLAHGPIFLALFVTGLLGSVGHCVGMCGPFVLSQTVARLDRVPAREMREWHRLMGAALVPYHLGRHVTYAALGAVAAGLAGGLIDVSRLQWLPAVLLALAAFFFLGYGLSRLSIRLPWLSQGGSAWWSRLFGRRLKRLFADPTGWRGFTLGVVLGFLPCGLLYGAIAAAAATGEPLAGFFAMAAFAVGTVPALLAVGLAGQLAARQWQTAAVRALPVLMFVNAAVLAALAVRMVA